MARAHPSARWDSGSTAQQAAAGDAGVRGSFVLAGVLLGVGLGGFVDGIVLHQVLQWHHMLTAHGDYPANTVAGLETNTLWDGLFHTFAWLATVIGVALIWEHVPLKKPGHGRALVGLLAIGWGVFNLVEGVVDHHVLTIHHVRDDVSNKLPWDVGFLVFGAALTIAGAALVAAGRTRALAAAALVRR
jgi:uncharacterized membrane protein